MDACYGLLRKVFAADSSQTKDLTHRLCTRLPTLLRRIRMRQTAVSRPKEMLMKFPHRAVVAVAAAVLAAVFAISGCSSSNNGTGGGGSSPSAGNSDAANLVKQAAD